MSYHIQKPRWESVSTATKLPPVDSITLNEDEQAAFLDPVSELEKFDPIADPDAFVLQAQLLAATLPERLRKGLLTFRRFGNKSGGYLIRGLPIGEIPTTPVFANHTLGAGLVGARSMALVLGMFGEQIGYLPELGGMIYQNISPMPGREETQQSVSSRAVLLMHNETVFTQNRADAVALLCLRADHLGTAGTTLSSARVVFSQLTEREIQVLREPRWATTVDESFLLGAKIDGGVLIGAISILQGSDLRPRFRCDFAETRPLEPSDYEAKRVLERLKELVRNSALTIQLRPMDLLLVDNHEAFHGRTDFVAQFDGFDRWLLRSFAVRDLSRSVADRPGDRRIVDRDYTTGPEVLFTGRISA